MSVRLATPADDADLRRLCTQMPVSGWVRLACTHEPSFFRGLDCLGTDHQVAVLDDAAGGLAGCGVRSIRRVWVRGQAMELGYLSGLRSGPASRRAGGLVRGYRFLHDRHAADRRVPAYLTTVLEDNQAARDLLTSGRAGLPRYIEQARLLTLALPLRRSRTPPSLRLPPGLALRRSAEVGLGAIAEFLASAGARRLFLPCTDADGLAAGHLPGFDPATFRVLVSADSRLHAVAALWDQSGARQWRVLGYSPAVRVLRPLANPALALAGRPQLPAVGVALRLAYVAFCCIADDRPELLAALLQALTADAAAAGHDFLALTLDERDPLRAAVPAAGAFVCRSRLYLAAWDDGDAFCRSLPADAVRHVEAGML